MINVRVYCFELRGENDALIMSTEIDDEANPAADAEFWARFLQGDCVMQYTGNVLEEKEDDARELNANPTVVHRI